MGHRSRHGATWRTTKQPSIRHGGTWRAASAAWIRQGGSWVKWWPDLPDRGGPYLYGSIASVGPNICRYDGSVWDSVGGGLASAIHTAALNDAGQIFASITGLSSRLWNGSTWATIQPLYYNSTTLAKVACDGTDFAIARHTSGFDPVTVWRFTPAGSDSILGYFSTSAPDSASVRLIGYGSNGLYIDGNFDVPDYPPLMDGNSAASYARQCMSRQLDGNLWGGPASYISGKIQKETGYNTFADVGGVVTGSVLDICALPDGRAWAAGDFTAIDGVSCSGLAEWDGSAWQPLGSLGYVAGLSYHQDKLWILVGATVTSRTVYTWDGTTLASHSSWSGETIYGIL
jgi:hypothetical protein